jgi:hypothetical protein
LLKRGNELFKGELLKRNEWLREIAEGRIAEGKRIAKGEFLRGNC